MSGIIGDSGSRSGIVGQTELSYETGTWGATYSGYSGDNNISNETYTRIGNIVYIFLRCAGDGTSDGSQFVVQGLPFVPSANGGVTVSNANSNYDSGDFYTFRVYGSGGVGYISGHEPDYTDLTYDMLDFGNAKFVELYGFYPIA